MRIKYVDPLHEGRCRAHSQGEGWPHHFLRRGVGVLDWEIAWTPNVALWSSNSGSPHRVVQSSALKVATNTSLSKHVAPNNPQGAHSPKEGILVLGCPFKWGPYHALDTSA